MRGMSGIWKYLVWVSALSASLVGPLVVSVLVALWLQDRFALGSWIMLVAIALGLAAAVWNLFKFFRFMQQESEHSNQEDRHGRF
ncbi:AtpZ/AtpI family protein [Intestinibacillus sp. Marseille-P6563]|uniref:AtpZ/AtpI family protein n=1 Tax=Intestinibacillus sp. Marseille-P6563 TaxID=2364792 RepID=UPI000F064DFD|nr:AtpZ/AtpI family protein [Intestinibacillus sp. Marseille-P6563]